LPNLFNDFIIGVALSVVQNIELDFAVLFLRDFPDDAVLAFGAFLDSNIVGCNPLQHIFAFSYVNNLIVQLDTVNAWVFILGSQTVPAKARTDVGYITVFQFLTSIYFSLYLTYIL
jgi:hypothetical protein